MFAFLQRNRAVVVTVAVAGAVAGALALPRLGSGIYPEVEFPRIAVAVRGSDQPPEVMQAVAVRQVEEALATVLGVRRIRSRIIRGAAEIQLFFAPGTDMWRALQFVDARLAEARADLPEGTELEAERLTPAEFPILAFDLAGGADGRARLEAAERVVRPVVSRAAGVARVMIVGGDRREIDVIPDPARLAALGLRPSTLAAGIGEMLLRRAVGRYDAVHQTSAVLVESPEATAAAMARLPVPGLEGPPLPLGALARVEEGRADRSLLVHGSEGEAVQIAISRLPGASTPDVAAAVLAELEGLELPPGMHLAKTYDQGDLVREALSGIRDAILLGILLTAAVLALFLSDLRAGLLAGLALPATLLATFTVMEWAGQTLNLMSLGGLAIAIGLVIDDAVVVVEAVMARRERGASRLDALSQGLTDVAAPVVGTTLTTVVVFLPLVFLEGMVGRFFAALAATLSAAVLLSMAFALFVLPVLGARLLPEEAKAASRPRFRRLRTRYGWWLRRGLRRRALLLGAGALAVAAGCAALWKVPTGFLPEFDEGTFVLDYFLPAGTSLADTDRAALEIESELRAHPAVAGWSRRTGAELGPVTATVFNSGDITVRLKPRRERVESDEVIDELRGQIARAVPSARIEFMQLIEDVLSDLAGAPRPIEVRISGDDPQEIERAARELAAKAGEIDGLVDFYAGVEGRVPTLYVEPDATALARLGLTPAGLGDDLETALRGRVVGSVPWLDRLLDVRVRYPDAVRFDPAAIRRLPVVVRDGAVVAAGSVALESVARVEERPEPSVLFREDLRPVAIASGDVEGGDLGKVAAAVEEALRGIRPPKGGRFELGGRAESQRQTFGELAGVFLLGLLAVLAVLVGQFRALRPCFIVLATLPPALAGAFLSLAATGVPLNSSSLIGIVLLSGLVVKNGILLLERAQRGEEAGLPSRTAILVAARARVRPILMTTLCTIFGLLPLAFGVGVAGEMQRPLAVTVVGGLFVSTAATLFVLPALALRRAARPARAVL